MDFDLEETQISTQLRHNLVEQERSELNYIINYHIANFSIHYVYSTIFRTTNSNTTTLKTTRLQYNPTSE